MVYYFSECVCVCVCVCVCMCTYVYTLRMQKQCKTTYVYVQPFFGILLEELEQVCVLSKHAGISV